MKLQDQTKKTRERKKAASSGRRRANPTLSRRLKVAGEHRLSDDEFDRVFGDLPQDREG